MRKGFTLTELLVVIFIISVLAALLLPGVHKVTGRANVSKARHELTALAQTELMVESDTGYFVPLEFLDNNGTGGASSTDDVNNTVIPNIDAEGNSISISSGDWKGPYTSFREIGPNRRPADPWGNQYQLDTSSSPYRIRSFGPDGDNDNWTEYNPSTGNGDIVYKFQ